MSGAPSCACRAPRTKTTSQTAGRAASTPPRRGPPHACKTPINTTLRPAGRAVRAHLHVGARVLPGHGVEEGGREHGRRLHLVLRQHRGQLRHVADPHVEGRAHEGHIGYRALPPTPAPAHMPQTPAHAATAGSSRPCRLETDWRAALIDALHVTLLQLPLITVRRV
jgi:hypothetical protein